MNAKSDTNLGLEYPDLYPIFQFSNPSPEFVCGLLSGCCFYAVDHWHIFLKLYINSSTNSFTHLEKHTDSGS